TTRTDPHRVISGEGGVQVRKLCLLMNLVAAVCVAATGEVPEQWLTRFDGRGFTVQPDHGGWEWGLALESYGYAGRERIVATPARVASEDQRVTYTWDRTIEEWFVNDSSGLEHGFTLRERPDGTGTGLLMIRLAVRGGLRPRVQAHGNAV